MQQPFVFRLPVHKFDLSVLPADARQIGSTAFNDAVIEYFAAQYATKNETALVSIDNEEITVVTLPKDSNPLDFVMTMLQSERIKEAIPYLESMAKLTPHDVQVLYNLGIAHSELGHFDEAIIRLKKAVQLDPSHAHAWVGIGVAYQRMGQSKQAREALQRAVEIAPDDGYAQRNLGAVLAALGKLQEAEQHLRKARERMPDDAQAIYGLAQVLDKSGGDKNEVEADRLYEELIRRFPASPAAEEARTARTRIAHKSLRARTSKGFRPDVMAYIAGALDTLEKVEPKKGQEIAFEIAMLGQTGLDINDPTPKYRLSTLPGTFSGLHLVSIMYAAFKQIDPSLDSGVDFSAEYEMAKGLRTK